MPKKTKNKKGKTMSKQQMELFLVLIFGLALYQVFVNAVEDFATQMNIPSITIPLHDLLPPVFSSNFVVSSVVMFWLIIAVGIVLILKYYFNYTGDN